MCLNHAHESQSALILMCFHEEKKPTLTLTLALALTLTLTLMMDGTSIRGIIACWSWDIALKKIDEDE